MDSFIREIEASGQIGNSMDTDCLVIMTAKVSIGLLEGSMMNPTAASAASRVADARSRQSDRKQGSAPSRN